MKYCLVADYGKAQVVVMESNNFGQIHSYALYCSIETCYTSAPCKFHVCHRKTSKNGKKRIVIETWEKGVKL